MITVQYYDSGLSEPNVDWGHTMEDKYELVIQLRLSHQLEEIPPDISLKNRVD